MTDTAPSPHIKDSSDQAFMQDVIEAYDGSVTALNLLGLGLVGSYAWRAYENTKARPLAVVFARHNNGTED